MRKIWITGKLLTVGMAWWTAITVGVGMLYYLLCDVTGRAQLHGPQSMMELACSALQIALGGVAGGLLWGARKRSADTPHAECEVPASVRDDVSVGVGWAYFSGVMTLLVGALSFVACNASWVPTNGHSLLFVGMSIIFLAYGVSTRSRTCAILLMLAYLLGLPMKMAFYRESGTLMHAAGLALLQSSIVLWAYWRGIRGTFRYHQWLKMPRFEATRPLKVEPDYGFRWGRPVR